MRNMGKVHKRSSRVLVTGGAGFLGSHVCERLVAERKDVVCLDNFCTGSEQNIAHLLREDNFELVRQDITQPLCVEVAQIYNLASPASPRHYQRNPVETVRTNVVGVMNVLELARSNHATILQASTSEIYGDPEIHPQVESYLGSVNPIGPRACYDEGKRCAETLCYDYWRQHKVSVKVARIFNTYGPRMHPQDGRVVTSFIWCALKNEPLTIYGDGTQTRSFCYVDDLVEGLVQLMHSRDRCTGPLNLGNPEEVTVRDLAEQIIILTGSKSVIKMSCKAEDDPRRRRPDISLARRELSWEPRVGLRNGLLKTISYLAHELRRCTEKPAKDVSANSERYSIATSSGQGAQAADVHAGAKERNNSAEEGLTREFHVQSLAGSVTSE